jgi:hypothetical protein
MMKRVFFERRRNFFSSPDGSGILFLLQKEKDTADSG